MSGPATEAARSADAHRTRYPDWAEPPPADWSDPVTPHPGLMQRPSSTVATSKGVEQALAITSERLGVSMLYLTVFPARSNHR
jgi:uncharacterized RmlC-like cupin family protein